VAATKRERQTRGVTASESLDRMTGHVGDGGVRGDGRERRRAGSRACDSLACQLRRPGSPARAVGVATVAVPVPTCTVTTGGHQGVASDGSRKGGAKELSRRFRGV
jgi:hypothetical protein